MGMMTEPPGADFDHDTLGLHARGTSLRRAARPDAEGAEAGAPWTVADDAAPRQGGKTR